VFIPQAPFTPPPIFYLNKCGGFHSLFLADYFYSLIQAATIVPPQKKLNFTQKSAPALPVVAGFFFPCRQLSG